MLDFYRKINQIKTKGKQKITLICKSLFWKVIYTLESNITRRSTKYD
jgi:hypothetical protein